MNSSFYIYYTPGIFGQEDKAQMCSQGLLGLDPVNISAGLSSEADIDPLCYQRTGL